MDNIRTDQEVQLVEKQMPTLVEKAKTLKVTDELSSKVANDAMKGSKEFINKLEVRRKFFVKPLQDHVSNINAEFKKLTIPLTEAYNLVRGKLTTYVVDLENKRKADEEKKKLEQSTKSEAAADFLGEKAPAAPTEEVRKESTVVHSALGKSHSKKIWTYEVEDFEKIPNSLKKLDEPKVNAMIKVNTQTIKGVSKCDVEIPGIKIYQKTILAVR